MALFKRLGSLFREFSALAVDYDNSSSGLLATQVQEALDRIIEQIGMKPKYIICDQDSSFNCQSFRDWCKDTGIKPPRYGAIGKHGSIAVIERFWKTLKYHWLQHIAIARGQNQFHEQLELMRRWYNEFKPHSTLGGRTPEEVYSNAREPKCNQPRHEPRPNYPINAPRLKSKPPVRGSPGQKLKLCVTFLDPETKRLPAITLREAA